MSKSPRHQSPKDVPAAYMMTSFKSNSFKKTGGSNEITMNDDPGKEGLFFKAEKDQINSIGNDSEVVIGNDEMINVGNDRVVTIGHDNDERVGNDETVEVANNRTKTVGNIDTHSVGLAKLTTTGVTHNDIVGVLRGTQTGVVSTDLTGLARAEVVGVARLTVIGMADIQFTGRSKIEKTGSSYSLDAGSEIGLTAGSNLLAEAAAEMGLKAGGQIVIEAPDITLKAAGGFIRIDASGVTIQGTTVKINCAGATAGSLSGGAPAADAGAGGPGGGGSAASAAAAAAGPKTTLGGLLGTLGVSAEYTDIVDTVLTNPLDLKIADLVKIAPTFENLLGYLPDDVIPPQLKSALANLLRIGRGEMTDDPQAVQQGLDALKKQAKDEIKKQVKENTGLDLDAMSGGKEKDAKKDGKTTTKEGAKNLTDPPGTSQTTRAPSGGRDTGAGNAPPPSTPSGGASSPEAPVPTPPGNIVPPYREMEDFAREQGFHVTSTTGGGHNTNSAHYQGRAIDVRTRDKTDAEVEAFIRRAREQGYTVRDERTHPPGQRVWSGPHLHLERPM